MKSALLPNLETCSLLKNTRLLFTTLVSCYNHLLLPINFSVSSTCLTYQQCWCSPYVLLLLLTWALSWTLANSLVNHQFLRFPPHPCQCLSFSNFTSPLHHHLLIGDQDEDYLLWLSLIFFIFNICGILLF